MSEAEAVTPPTSAPPASTPPALLASPAAAAALRSLDADQRAVVRWTPADGNLAVVASAGSGKSRSVVALVVGLLIRRIVPPGRIVLATFTRAGADVFRQRLEPLIGAYAAEAIYMGTWHALARQYLQSTQPWRWPDAANLSLPDNGLIVRPGGGVHGLKDGKGRPRRREADDTGRSLRTYDLWRTILGFGMIPGLDRKGMDLKLEDQGLDVRDYMQQVGILRGHGLFPGARAIDAGHLPRFIDAWKLYEGAKRTLRAFDFDDLLVAWRSALRRTQEGDWTDDRPAPDATWEPQPFDPARGRIVIVDEGQDQSGVQLDIGRRLAGPAGRMVLVGDPRQCIPFGEPIRVSSERSVPVETLAVGDSVLASVQGRPTACRVRAVSTSIKPGAWRFTTANGKVFRATAEHVVFAALGAPAGWYVYLMWRHGYGFRLGSTQVTGRNGLQHLLVRTQQEGAERLWLLECCHIAREAAILEHTLAYRHGVPMAAFKPRPATMHEAAEEGAVRTFFAEFAENGHRVLARYALDFDRPTYVAKASNRGLVAVNLLIGATKGPGGVEVGADSNLLPRDIPSAVPTRRGGWRVRRWFPDIVPARAFASTVVTACEAAGLRAYVVERLSLPHASKRLFTMPASGLLPGLFVPTYEEGRIVLSLVTHRTYEEGPIECADLEVERAHNFMVGDVVVHNSIFGFQGAHSKAFATGIEKMMGHLVGLPNNYRSGPQIVAAGNALVKGQSWAIGEPARAVRTDIEGVVTVRRWGQDPEEGAEFVVREVEARIASGHRAGDFAILTRSNAEAGLYEAALLRARLPVQVLGRAGLLGTPQGRIFIAWSRLVTDGARDDLDEARRKDLGLALLEAYRHPNRYLSRAWADDTAKRLLTGRGAPSLIGVLEEEIARKGTSGQQRGRVQGLLRELESLTKQAADGDWPAAADRIGAMLLPRKPAVGARRHEDPALVLAALARVAGASASGAEFLALGAQGAGASAGVAGSEVAGSEQATAGDSHVTVGTIHQAKGREYRIVYVPMTGGMFPAPMAMRDGQEPEERRLAYVAVTRAMDEVHVGWTVRRLASGAGGEAARGGPGAYAQELAEWLSADTGSSLGVSVQPAGAAS